MILITDGLLSLAIIKGDYFVLVLNHEMSSVGSLSGWIIPDPVAWVPVQGGNQEVERLAVEERMMIIRMQRRKEQDQLVVYVTPWDTIREHALIITEPITLINNKLTH